MKVISLVIAIISLLLPIASMAELPSRTDQHREILDIGLPNGRRSEDEETHIGWLLCKGDR